MNDLDLYNQRYRFQVKIDGLDGVVDFRAVEGLNVQLDVVELYEGGENSRHHKLVGGTRYSNLVFRRGTTDSLDLFTWVKETIDGKIQRRNGHVVALSQAGEPVCRWEFKEAWPCRYEGPDFVAAQDELAIEAIELAHNGFEMKK
jgi:phage tail-like protein